MKKYLLPFDVDIDNRDNGDAPLDFKISCTMDALNKILRYASREGDRVSAAPDLMPVTFSEKKYIDRDFDKWSGLRECGLPLYKCVIDFGELDGDEFEFIPLVNENALFDALTDSRFNVLIFAGDTSGKLCEGDDGYWTCVRDNRVMP